MPQLKFFYNCHGKRGNSITISTNEEEDELLGFPDFEERECMIAWLMGIHQAPVQQHVKWLSWTVCLENNSFTLTIHRMFMRRVLLTSRIASIETGAVAQSAVALPTDLQYHMQLSEHTDSGATVAERLVCSPPIKSIRVQSPAGPLRISFISALLQTQINDPRRLSIPRCYEPSKSLHTLKQTSPEKWIGVGGPVFFCLLYRMFTFKVDFKCGHFIVEQRLTRNSVALSSSVTAENFDFCSYKSALLRGSNLTSFYRSEHGSINWWVASGFSHAKLCKVWKEGVESYVQALSARRSISIRLRVTQLAVHAKSLALSGDGALINALQCRPHCFRASRPQTSKNATGIAGALILRFHTAVCYKSNGVWLCWVHGRLFCVNMLTLSDALIFIFYVPGTASLDQMGFYGHHWIAFETLFPTMINSELKRQTVSPDFVIIGFSGLPPTMVAHLKTYLRQKAWTFNITEYPHALVKVVHAFTCISCPGVDAGISEVGRAFATGRAKMGPCRLGKPLSVAVYHRLSSRRPPPSRDLGAATEHTTTGRGLLGDAAEHSVYSMACTNQDEADSVAARQRRVCCVKFLCCDCRRQPATEKKKKDKTIAFKPTTVELRLHLVELAKLSCLYWWNPRPWLQLTGCVTFHNGRGIRPMATSSPDSHKVIIGERETGFPFDVTLSVLISEHQNHRLKMRKTDLAGCVQPISVSQHGTAFLPTLATMHISFLGPPSPNVTCGCGITLRFFRNAAQGPTVITEWSGVMLHRQLLYFNLNIEVSKESKRVKRGSVRSWCIQDYKPERLAAHICRDCKLKGLDDVASPEEVFRIGRCVIVGVGEGGGRSEVRWKTGRPTVTSAMFDMRNSGVTPTDSRTRWRKESGLTAVPGNCFGFLEEGGGGRLPRKKSVYNNVLGSCASLAGAGTPFATRSSRHRARKKRRVESVKSCVAPGTVWQRGSSVRTSPPAPPLPGQGPSRCCKSGMLFHPLPLRTRHPAPLTSARGKYPVFGDGVCRCNPFTLTSAFPQALLKFYFQDIPPPRALPFPPPSSFRYVSSHSSILRSGCSYRSVPRVGQPAPTNELCSILGGVAPGFSHVRIVPDDAAGRRTALNIEVLSADDGEVRMKQRRNERAGETGDPRENTATSGIVLHYSYLRKFRVNLPGIESGLPW
ncbi:hypothetical protein PR048_025339 [Dryococelus australis]|uniref:Uncharacterized protein n=1 Tax=Dryococelus australis TaxID=614101 RepID=A0ABQ9GR45_9NEOP|nr:hypothetical protein PR048_025339 [Dryococelus australis]